MAEASSALFLFGLFATGSWARTTLSWDALLVLGSILVTAGLLASVVGGLLYHLRLYGCLQPRHALPVGWYWQPTRLHPQLRPHERMRVLPWFALGALGFCACLLGCAAVLLAAWRA